MRVLVDTNVLIDVFTERSGYGSSKDFLRLAGDRSMTLLVTVGQTTDIFYILSRYPQTKDKAPDIVKFVGEHMTLADTLVIDYKNAIDSNFNDFEDAILAYAAKRLHAAYIVTGNKQDFVNSPVMAMSPKEFMDKFYPAKQTEESE